MLPIDSYPLLVSDLTEAFQTRYPPESNVRVCGLLLARPSSKFVQGEILPHMEYFDRNSADHIDFFCIGYQPHPLTGDLPSDVLVVTSNVDTRWSFSVEQFVGFKAALEVGKKWSYSGGADLLLLNARYDRSVAEAELDFGTVIPMKLEDAIQDGAIKSVERLLESIVRLSKELTTDDPTFELSDRLALELGKRDIISVLSKILPYGIGELGKKYQHFATRGVIARGVA